MANHVQADVQADEHNEFLGVCPQNWHAIIQALHVDERRFGSALSKTRRTELWER
jgi:hypothetical protein